MAIDPSHPETFPRRVLLAVTGLSPQVLTETLYALVRESKPAFVPTEIHIVTTAEGARQAESKLLGSDTGWFHRFCKDYKLSGEIKFDRSCIHTIPLADGKEMEDVRTPADNALAADAITERVRELCNDKHTALHVSIAGGRKTMGFFLGYALSLFGRVQDRLSHVLVSEPFEGLPDFYYPPLEPRVIFTPDGKRSARTSEARIHLAEIPFVRLRDGLPSEIQLGQARFSKAVAAAQQSVGPLELTANFANCELICGGKRIAFAPQQFAFYAWHAERRMALGEQAGTSWTQRDEMPHEEFLKVYFRALQYDDTSTSFREAAKALRCGFGKDDWGERISRINKKLRQELGRLNAEPYLIHALGKSGDGYKLYGLQLPAERIRIVGDEPPKNKLHQRAGRN